MAWNPNKLVTFAVLVLTGSLFMMAGCSSDDPVTSATAPADGDATPQTDQALWEAAIAGGLLAPDDPDGNNLGVSKLPFPSSPDQLMENFRTVYETADVGEYLKIMHMDFMTVLQQETIDEFPDVGTTLERYEEQNIHKRMFLGQPVNDPQGDLVPGVTGIYFNGFAMLDTWQISPPGDVIPDALWAPFEVDISFDRGQSYSTMEVEGIIKFYLVGQDFEVDGATHQFYQMLGQVDLTNTAKSVETSSWGTVKALYR